MNSLLKKIILKKDTKNILKTKKCAISYTHMLPICDKYNIFSGLELMLNLN